jgi:hypothetical protein
VFAGRDADDWKDQRLPPARKLQLAAWQQFDDKAAPVLNKNWRRRQADELQAAREALAESVGDLDRALGIISAAGPYRTERWGTAPGSPGNLATQPRSWSSANAAWSRANAGPIKTSGNWRNWPRHRCVPRPLQ